METFAFFAITFEPIGILTHSAHQNDRLNLSFVKDNHTGSQKMAINGSKTAIYFVIFISKQSLGCLISFHCYVTVNRKRKRQMYLLESPNFSCR